MNSGMEYLYVAGGAVTIVYFVMVLLRRSSIRLKNIEPKMYNALIRFPLHQGGFDAALSFPKSVMKDIKYKKGLLQVDYQVPRSICFELEDVNSTEGLKPRYVLALGGILALGDSLTTFVMMTDDSLHRPGVSVSLSGSVVNTIGIGATESNTIYAGDIISIICRTTKVGATLGFCEAFFIKNNRVLGHVRHIKYLKMGYLFDSWVGPLLPLYFDISCMMSRDGSLRPTKKSVLKKLLTGCEVLLQDSLNLSETTVGAGTDAVFTRSFSAVVHKAVENPFGSLHGGAVACMAAEAASRSLNDGKTTTSALEGTSHSRVKRAQATAMEINYLAPAKGKMDVSVRPVMTTGSNMFFAHKTTDAIDQTCDSLAREVAACEICHLDDLIVGEEAKSSASSSTKITESSCSNRCQAEEDGTCSSVVLNVVLKKALLSTAGVDGSKSKSKGNSRNKEKIFADCKVTMSFNV